MKRSKSSHSFRSTLSMATMVCWILPIVILCVMTSFLLNRNYNRNLRQVTESNVSSAMRQLELRLSSAIEDSKAISYDGTVPEAYQAYCSGTPGEEIYRQINEYLYSKFSRNLLYRAAFVSFLDPELDILPFATAPGVSNAELLRHFFRQVLPASRELTSHQDAGIFFMVVDDRIYLVRNLLDRSFTPYAIFIIELETAELMQSVYALANEQALEITIDGIALPYDVSEINIEPSRRADMRYTSEVDGHTVAFSGQVVGLNIWTTLPMLRWVVLSACVLVIPMLAIIVFLFYRNVNKPIRILIDANSCIRRGQRGYQIETIPPNREFALLYHDFNAMSSELKNQFEQLYEEQQALQQAKLKALQSQINPHFLNNTLEVINWEARLADNERVCSMLEALSTMLDAAISRDGRSMLPLREELKYVDAYLHITKERLGDRLTITKKIDPETLDSIVPLLMVQPILENAVEYDLSRTGGELSLRAFFREGMLHLEVEHDGQISLAGMEILKTSLRQGEPSGNAPGRSVGIRNVVNRLTLLYGGVASMDIRQITPGRILAEVILPPSPAKN